jgi:hypothetical protein
MGWTAIAVLAPLLAWGIFLYADHAEFPTGPVRL